ncbi:endoglucanase [Microlunatus sagamiharensis]|uniref:Endoglucanase n=1 Tax=Microlunatus sagamiharensis TaxID=546874 RepID=A0A1H2LQV8_9ACTN|nr:glycosyl hydrolase family 8 [Microlunatus sagamiharensis]SDU83393.1 endoglucanase [Microlunatus sagamiharensis]
MRAPVVRRVAVVGVLAVLVAAVLALVSTRPGPEPGSSAAGASGAPGTPDPSPTLRQLTAEEAGQAFLSGYVDPDGRVVRRDQGGDTVSEGQAYAMLVAAAVGDRTTFTSVWSWTRANLLRPDGTLSWRWADGAVVDPESASDADLDAARALVVAGDRFDDPSLTDAGTTLGTAILDAETVETKLGRVLTAGTWATAEPYAYNPSYASPAAYDVLAKASDDQRWAELEEGSRAATTRVLAATDLPPDWAQVHADGRVDPMPGAAGRGNDGVRYGYDATRLPLRYAESCSAEDQALAARLAPALGRFGGSPAARDLGGQPLTADSSVVAVAAEAAVAASTGDQASADAALVRADHLQQQVPTYYGGAWDALGRMLLTDPVLGGCPPLAR